MEDCSLIHDCETAHTIDPASDEYNRRHVKELKREKPSKEKRKQNGRYDFANMELQCTCYHKLGIHTAGENEKGLKDCLAGDFYGFSRCECAGFTLKTPKK
mgnify:FL=1